MEKREDRREEREMNLGCLGCLRSRRALLLGAVKKEKNRLLLLGAVQIEKNRLLWRMHLSFLVLDCLLLHGQGETFRSGRIC